MSTFQTHTGTAFRAAQRDGFHISIKRPEGVVGGWVVGREWRRGWVESGPSNTMNSFEWSICFSVLLLLFIITADTRVMGGRGVLLTLFFRPAFPYMGAPQPGPEIIRLQWKPRLYNTAQKKVAALWGGQEGPKYSVCVQAFMFCSVHVRTRMCDFMCVCVFEGEGLHYTCAMA